MIKLFRKSLLYALPALLLVSGALCWTRPLSIVNYFLPNSVALLNDSGTLGHGSWQDIEINGRRYPLSCNYQNHSLNFSGVTYILNCDAPLVMRATISVTPQGDTLLTDGFISGDIAELSPWLALSGIPVKLSGDVDISIAKANIESRTLNYLDVNGSIQNVRLLDTLLFNQLNIETLNKALLNNQFIVLTTQTHNIEENTVELYTISTIDGKNHVTTGEMRGDKLKNYAVILRFFAQQMGNNHFSVQFQGGLF